MNNQGILFEWENTYLNQPKTASHNKEIKNSQVNDFLILIQLQTELTAVDFIVSFCNTICTFTQKNFALTTVDSLWGLQTYSYIQRGELLLLLWNYGIKISCCKTVNNIKSDALFSREMKKCQISSIKGRQTWMVYISSSLLQLTVQSHDLSQAEKKNTPTPWITRIHPKLEDPLKGGWAIFFKLVHMQHYQIFRLSDSHIFIKNCHLWQIDF